MKNNAILYSVLIVLIFSFVSCTESRESRDLNGNGSIEIYEDTSRPLSERVEDIIPRLTMEQKVRMLVGRGMSMPGMNEDLEEKVDGAAGSTYGIDSLGLPSLTLADGPAGLRIQPVRNQDSSKTYYATAFPIASLMAATWDTDLVHRVGEAMGTEVKEYGVDVLLAPALNIHRNPLTGRNFEYYSEDPLLSGKMAAAMVNGVESMGVGTSIKHFVANNQETNRMIINTIVGERALREIYLKGFEIAVKEAQPWTVMSAYNTINGTPASQNADLLTTVLRDDWGFEGLVMTDWFAGRDAVAQMRAGNDLLMPGTPDQFEEIMNALEDGSLSESVIDRNVKNLLKIILESPTIKDYDYSDNPDLEGHAEVARQAAAEGMVLLENADDTLPLDEEDLTVTAFGNTSYDFISGGTGSGDVNEAYTVSLVQGMQSEGFSFQEDIRQRYETYLKEQKAQQPEPQSIFDRPPPIPEMELSSEDIAASVGQSDIAVITIGRNSGEFADRTLEGDYYLTDTEHQLIDAVTEAFHAEGKKVVVILNTGNVIETVTWKDQVDAVLLAWQGGQESGNAVADVLSGRVNPSGKLPTTFTNDYEDVPSSENFPGEELSDEPIMGMAGFPLGVPSEVIYEEGIYVGYRYFSTFDVSTSYPFGYGLSYTDFEYEGLQLSSDTFDDQISVSVEVVNSGDVAGKEIVQVYLKAPEGQLDKPEMELKGFAKTGLLQPGGSETVEIVLTPDKLASYDADRSAWVAEPGTYEVQVGASSEDIRSTDTFTLGNELVVEETSNALVPNREIESIY